MTPTWPQIRGLTYSTIGRNLAGTMHSGSGPRRVYFEHPNRWRTEDPVGTPIWIDTPTDSWTFPDDGGRATHFRKNPRAIVSIVGGPGVRELLQPHRWWPAENRLSQIDIGEPDGPRPVEVRGRKGYELVFPNAGSPITVVVDAEIGVALRWEQNGEAIELSDPGIDLASDPALFTWDGPVLDEDDPTVSDEQRAHEARMRAVADMPTTVVGHLPVTVSGSPLDGDPLTGALDVTVHGQSPQVVVRRWLSELPEPEVSFHISHFVHAWRRELGPWTVEVRAHREFAEDDVDRLLDSLRLPDPPGDIDAIVREADRRQQEHDAFALRERLGTGRALEDLLTAEYSPSLLIRTDFADDQRWAEVALAAMEPVESGDPQFPTFEANLVCVDNPENEGLSSSGLVDRTGDDPPFYAFIADSRSMTDPEMPILVVDLGRTEWGADPGRTFRVIPSEMWGVENNLSISNMDFRDFADAVDDDGVFRGFPPSPPVVATMDREDLVALSATNRSTPALKRFAEDLAHLDNPYAVIHESERERLFVAVSSLDENENEIRDGVDEYLAATAHKGRCHSGFVQVLAGHWSMVIDPDSGRLEAAMLRKYSPPENS